MRTLLTVAALAALTNAEAQPVPFAGVPWLGFNAGSSAYAGNPAPFERDPTAIATGDLDGDGDLDVVVSNYEYAAPGGGTNGMSGFVVLLNQGDAVYGDPSHYTVSSRGSWDIALGDFDEDGDLDVVVPVADAFWETGNTVALFLNDGAGAFPVSRTFTVGGPAPTGVAVADFDGDGHLDVATANHQNFQEDGSLSIPAPGVLGNDVDPEGQPLSAVLVSGPAHGTLTLNPNGSFTYTPAANYNGPDEFWYQASDGINLGDPVAVTLTVNSVIHARPSRW